MKKIKAKDAVGMSICHDMTRIIPGKSKGVAFKKGHIITEDDLSILEKMGKENIYVYEDKPGFIHEDDSALRIGNAICNSREFDFSDIKEGKLNIHSKRSGLIKIDREKLYELNRIEDISITTVYDNIIVSEGEKIASCRIIPMFTKKINIKKLEGICSFGKLFSVKPFLKKKIHLIITGNEIFKGLVEDAFYDTLKPKIEYYGSSIIRTLKLPDDDKLIENQIIRSVEQGADIVICTGGMSVDEDDLTPTSIIRASNEVITHGAPVQPGNMFMLAYRNKIPIVGIPTAAIYNKITLFDKVLPMLLCNEKPDGDFFIKLSLGGLCRSCSECHYPNCTYCKGR
ncbi:molybdopterin biosynthesis protein [Clostridium tyrobutyricum]|jgi:molybdopterin biosynthesis enzyme|uniref:Molybdopterin molybdenumtransferase n=1 Tax=Clostridium tyrobutyricum DIVETGP TaxID=1408889 RepID=W6N2I2_CLOTY|nr:molybdopterin-binding protein [Clostridium tyrobutyricum]AND84046.1 hypothetical protein CTK_C07850 [Clostridium tyrobutyricum]ANP68780.1 molybdopterin biosynthesis protein [Clostridium tyrobutyricum]MBR9647194.1 molybdopterin-binding protein [Clostridium tyrobutyricum]MBV4416193.1 molybdopterin-binding protein [Clostridium tyrobutyricum]MBV4416206.1 molybdopterin-binding protein [Clostridium tyrobutyricum]